MFDNLNIDQQRLYAILKRVLQRHVSEIEALNKSQLSKGLRSDGVSLPAYKPSYLKTRRKHGRPTSPMDLNLTGEFYSKWFTVFFDDYARIGSKDSKVGILEGRFSENIAGLTEESRNTLLWEYGVAGEFCEEFIKEFFG